MSRKEIMKVYHGIPKSITDEHTIFYASFDGTIEPEIGSVDVNTASDFISDPMGYHPTSGGNMLFTATKSVDVFTLDMYIPKFPKVSSGNKAIIALKTETGADLFYIQIPSQQDYLALVQTDNTGWHMLTKSQQDCFIRIVVNKGNVTNYINGIKISQRITIKSFTKFNKIRIMLGSSTWNGVADIHISDIDRGDYFPNLPQDFIDGKAIIKPRMGQQQIKGDPLYSQYTTVKIPAYNNNTNDYQLSPDGHKGYLISNPEIFDVSGAIDWIEGRYFKIKGLNGEIISGIIDSDTALAKIVKTQGSANTLYVDDTSKFVVGDTIRIYYNSTKINNMIDLIINNIDSESKIITVGGTISSNIGDLVFETTASSSSPVVKTEDGTVVTGTWSGLGTNEATFTLGENTGITGKDLYVEYSLNIPNNNSDFNELPHSIDKAYTENGIEMTPVNEIVITDDFKGKISGGIKECPHIAKASHSTSLLLPSNFTVDFINRDYSQISNNDSITKSTSSSESGVIPQKLFSFNLIEMVERKFGCEIPSVNKVQWLKDNLANNATITHYGYGCHPSGSLLNLSWFSAKSNTWTVPGGTHSSSSITRLDNGTNILSDRIDTNGMVHVCVYTNPSNGTTPSTIYTDYISLKIKLKLDSTYTTLYCSNSRAREDKCNPVLIQKETKTVKRYLPSKECFVTECKYVDMDRKLLSTSDMNSYYYKGTKVYSTTRGSGEYNSHTGVYPNIINLLRIPDYEAYTYKCEPLKNSPVTAKINMSFTEQLGESYTGNTLSAMPTELYAVLKYIQLVPFIRLNNGEIELMLYTSEVVDSGIEDYSKQMSKNYVYAYKLPNRPLIK